MPAMQDPYFSKTLTLICSHDSDGAMGIVINRPLQLTVDHLFEQIELPREHAAMTDKPVFFGGPVETERGFVLHTPHQEYNGTVAINEAVAVTSSKDILDALANDQGPEKALIALGYAGWTEGQLEQEFSHNAWLSLRPSSAQDFHRLIFDLPFDEKIEIAMSMIGVDYASLSDVAGHA